MIRVLLFVFVGLILSVVIPEGRAILGSNVAQASESDLGNVQKVVTSLMKELGWPDDAKYYSTGLFIKDLLTTIGKTDKPSLDHFIETLNNLTSDDFKNLPQQQKNSLVYIAGVDIKLVIHEYLGAK